MLPLLFFSLIIGVGGNSFGCPTNVTCIGKETCCQTKNGLWSCCPIENGICCNDGLHCCSKDDQCLENGKCISSTNHIYNSFSSIIKENSLKTVPCPDGNVCHEGQTCCEFSSTQYACCPLPDAVCCSDHIHCCPKDHHCDGESGHCKKKFNHLNDVPCPDGATVCPDGYTCCALPSSGYGCCPLVDAVCCNDHLHCCPRGEVCDIEHGRCVSQISIPWFTKKPAFRLKQKLIDDKEIELTKLNIEEIPSKLFVSLKSYSSVECPDKNQCPDETTCCQLSNSSYGCCPYSEGKCCSDKIHCCPNGYGCDESGNRCIRHFNKLNFKLKEIKKLLKPSDEQLCPDGITSCFTNSTCCPNKDKDSISYSCCPYSKGVCCGSNGSVCCPNNYDCNLDQLSCQLRDEKIILRNLLLTDNYNRCQSSDTYCTTDQTCCQTTSNNFACCPYPDGQCCSDGEHCCPIGTKCDLVLGGCSA